MLLSFTLIVKKRPIRPTIPGPGLRNSWLVCKEADFAAVFSTAVNGAMTGVSLD